MTKVHKEAVRFARQDYDILLVGHEGHEEVEGTAGEAPDVVHLVDGVEGVEAAPDFPEDQKLVWLSQTTLSVDETMQIVDKLHERYPNLENPPSDDICYATQNRQDAVKVLAPQTVSFSSSTTWPVPDGCYQIMFPWVIAGGGGGGAGAYGGGVG